MSTIKYEAAAVTTLMSTDLNALAAGSGAIATSAYDNATNLYLFGYFELQVDYVSAPTANGLIDLFLIPTVDATNYASTATGASEFAPLTTYAGSFQVQNSTAVQYLALGGPGAPFLISLPPLSFKAFITNNTSQAFPASGSTLKMVPYRYAVV
jgi:hypothetical protein